MKKLLIGLLTILIVISLSLGAYGYKTANSNIYIFSNSLKDTENKVNNLSSTFIKTLIPNEKLLSGTYSLDLVTSIQYQKEKIKSDIKLYSDAKINSAYLNAKLINKGNNLLIDMFLKDKKIYFKIKDFYDDFYYVNSDIKLDNKENKKYEKLLIKYLRESINEELTEDNFKNEDKTIILEKKKYNTNKITIKVTEKMVDVIEINYIKKISNDNDLTNYIANLEGTNAKELRNKMNEEVSRLSKKTSNEEVLSYSIYVYNNKTIKHEINMEKDLLVIEDYLYKNKNYINYKYLNNNKKIQEVNIIANKNNISINGEINKLKINSNAKIDKNSINYNGNILENNKKIGNISYVLKNDILTIKANINEMLLQSEGKISNEKIPNINVSKAKKFNTNSTNNLIKSLDN